MTPQQLVSPAAIRLGIDFLDIKWLPKDAPGGDDDNVAHVHAEADLRRFTVEFNFGNAESDQDARVAVIHESLHIALRHICAVVEGLDHGPAKQWLRQAIEEDTESLAVALEATWP